MDIDDELFELVDWIADVVNSVEPQYTDQGLDFLYGEQEIFAMPQCLSGEIPAKVFREILNKLTELIEKKTGEKVILYDQIVMDRRGCDQEVLTCVKLKYLN